MKKLTLKQVQRTENTFYYLVVQVVNDIHPKVGSTLSEKGVDVYCSDDNWTVTIRGE